MFVPAGVEDGGRTQGENSNSLGYVLLSLVIALWLTLWLYFKNPYFIQDLNPDPLMVGDPSKQRLAIAFASFFFIFVFGPMFLDLFSSLFAWYKLCKI